MKLILNLNIVSNQLDTIYNFVVKYQLQMYFNNLISTEI